MFWFFVAILAGAGVGLAGLFLISGDLAGRAGLTGGGRLLLAAGLGFGVVSILLKILIASVLLQMAGHLHPEPRLPAGSDQVVLPSFQAESIFTGPWQDLPPDPAGESDGRLAVEVANLGRRLFNDPDLSTDRKVACASCHKLESGGSDGSVVSTGIAGLRGSRNAPTVWNTRYLSRLFWDGRAASLEEQAKGPLTHPLEMGMPSEAAVENEVRAKPEYRDAFRRIYGADDAVTIDNIAHAIATYERTLVEPATDYDRFVRGDVAALTAQQIRGMALFAGLGCRTCHRDPTFSAAGTIKPAGVYKPFPMFSDNEYVRRYDLLSDRGVRAVDGAFSGQQAGLWRVPSLRNVANTAPYFHNGRVETLEEAIRVMAVTQLRRRVVSDRRRENPEISWDRASRKLSFYRPSELTPDDIGDIAAFLESISFKRADSARASPSTARD